MQKVAPPIHVAAPWAWAAISFVGWFASLWIALPFTSLVPSGTTSLEAGIRWDLAVFLALNAALSMAAVLAAGRLVFGRWLEVTSTDLEVPAVGVVLAIASEIALHEWAEARFGYYDFDFVGWNAGLGAALVVAAVATFAVQVAPRGAAAAPRIGQILAATLVSLIIASNGFGLRDGVEPAGWPLALLGGASGLYVLVAVVISWRRAGR